jgi:molybdenum cofactor cytidylyltransferase
MIFDVFPLDQAEGALLAHSRKVAGGMIKKGTRLDATSIERLREAGTTEVIAAKLDDGDLLENASADGLANRLEAPGLRRNPATTGRVNLIAEHAGLLRVDVEAINRINLVDEALTVATLPNYAVVAPGDMVATIKVIPFAVAAATQARVEVQAQGGAFSLHAFKPLKVGLVLSEIATLKDSIVTGTIDVTRNRVEALGGTLLPPRRCAHTTDAIAREIQALQAEGADILLVSGASAVVDRRDVGPAGIVQAGGEIEHFGMPVDPGNLICLGHIGTKPALVLPGCARSPKLNGIDWVLARLFAGIKVTGRDVMMMGVGGLLKDTETRPLPRARATTRPKVAAIVLAAGASSRMAPRHKLLVEGPDGRPMVARVVDHLLASKVRPILVVTGHRAPEIRQALAGRNVRFVQAEHHADGLAESLKAGLQALPEEAVAALICLGDMPLVQGAAIDRIVAAYDPDEGRRIVVPTYEGAFGNPVLWDRIFMPEMMALTGDTGARALLKRHPEAVAEVPMDDDSVLRDFDTPESLEALV